MVIEKILYDYLNAVLNVGAYPEEPEEKPKNYVLFRVIDYSEENHIATASVYLESVGESLLKAASLNSEVMDAARGLITLEEISAAKISGGGQNIDTATKKYRFQTVVNIVYYN